MVDYVGNMGYGFYIVDGSRFAPEAHLGWKRRFGTGVRPISFQ
jgi:hypothetical protein